MRRADQAPHDARGWSLTASASVIPLWRRTVVSVLQGWGADSRATELAAFGVSEVLANVVTHVSDPRCRLAIVREGDCFRVSVRDRSVDVPAVTVPAWDAEGGRGLWLLREMASELGYTLFPGGKDVWFRCPLASVGEGAA